MATDVRKLAQDAAYVTIGVGVLAFQRAQVARREVRGRVESVVSEARARVPVFAFLQKSSRSNG